MHDVIIVGGSYSGLAAAIQLGRARRSVLIVDAGKRRNRFATRSHGFLGQDGELASAIAAKGKAEALAYPTVAWRDAAVVEVKAEGGAFVARVADEALRAKRVILATGVVDDLPNIPGLEERWGQSIFACPYCHGYELQQGRIAVLATSPLSLHHVALVSEWGSQTTFFLNGAFEPDAAQLADLEGRGIHLERELVARVEGVAPAISVHLHDDRKMDFAGMFLASRTRLADPFAAQLGCELETWPLGAYYKTDPTKETTIPGVFACGDASLMAGSVALAVGEGVRAGVGAHQSLVFRT